MPILRRPMTDFLSLESFVPGQGLNATDDAQPGLLQPQPAGAILQGVKQGQLGIVISLDEADALRLSYTTTGTLHAGVYMYCQFYLSSTAANAVGGVLFWQSFANVVVTPDVTLATQGQIAGIGLMINTKGNYGWVQVQGRAGVLMKSSITKATPAAGDLVIVDQGGGTPTARGDVLADATNLTSVLAKSILGVAAATPVGATVILVDLEN